MAAKVERPRSVENTGLWELSTGLTAGKIWQFGLIIWRSWLVKKTVRNQALSRAEAVLTGFLIWHCRLFAINVHQP